MLGKKKTEPEVSQLMVQKSFSEMAEEKNFLDLLNNLEIETNRFSEKLSLLRDKVLLGTFNKTSDPARAAAKRASQDHSELSKEFRGFKFTKPAKKKKE